MTRLYVQSKSILCWSAISREESVRVCSIRVAG